MSEENENSVEAPISLLEARTKMVKPNTLINAKYHLTASQKDIMEYALGCIYAGKNNHITDEQVLSIDIDKLHRFTESTMRIDKYRKHIHQSLSDLMKQTLWVEQEDGKVIEYSWLSKREQSADLKTASFRLSKDIAREMSNISGNFTKYYVLTQLKLDTFESKRMYEILKQFIGMNIHSVKFEVEELRELFGVNKKNKKGEFIYKRFNNLNQKIIIPLIKDINSKSDIQIDIQTLRTGRSVTAIKFNFKQKPLHKEKSKNTSKKIDVKTLRKSKEDVHLICQNLTANLTMGNS